MSVRDAADSRAPELGAPEPGAPALAEVPRMPDLCRPRRGARHSLDTALRTLAACGVDDTRVTVESVGPGWPDGQLARQWPLSGTRLDGGIRVVLGVGGIGALDALPYALRDVTDSPFGVDALLALLDTPTFKLRFHLRAGGDFFALRDGDLVSARRWIEQVFQLDPTPWAPQRWPALARLLPLLHRVAGQPAGIAAGLRVMFGLPLLTVRAVRAVAVSRDTVRMALGNVASRLGVDTLLGFGPVDATRLVVEIGPVPLATYRHHHDGENGALTRERLALYRLLVPARFAAAVEERWVVGDPMSPVRLGDAFTGAPPATDDPARAEAAALGLTTRLGIPPALASTESR